MSMYLDVFPLSFCSKVLSIYKKKSRGKNAMVLVLCQERPMKIYYFVVLTPIQLLLIFYIFISVCICLFGYFYFFFPLNGRL